MKSGTEKRSRNIPTPTMNFQLPEPENIASSLARMNAGSRPPLFLNEDLPRLDDEFVLESSHGSDLIVSVSLVLGQLETAGAVA